MSVLSDLKIEANDAFYEWEAEHGYTDLSDRDREIWCAGYVCGGIAPYIEKLKELVSGMHEEDADDIIAMAEAMANEKVH